MVYESETAKHHYIQMEGFRQQQGHIDTKIRTLEREKNSLNESEQNPERVLEIETALSRMNKQAERYRQQIEKHMDMHHACSNYDLKQAMRAKQKTEELFQEKIKLLAKQVQMRHKEGKTAEEDRMNKVIKKLNKDIKKGKAETKKHREKFHDNQKKTMGNATKDLYDSFRKNAEEDVANTYVDNGGRVIQAVLEMDAKQVFDYLAENNATVCFSNRETLDLLINEQLSIHPRSIKQLYELSADPMSPDTNRRPSDFQEILKLKTQLQNFSRLDSNHQLAFQSSWNKVENNTKLKLKEKDIEFDRLREHYSSVSPSVFRKLVNGILQKHRMCTLEKVNAWKRDIDKVLKNSPTDQHLFENMTPAEAYRMKEVICKLDFNNEPHDNFKIAMVVAGVRLVKDLDLHGNIFRTADCIEIIKIYAGDKADKLKKKWDDVKNNTELKPKQKRKKFRKLRKEYGTDGTWKKTKETLKDWKTEYTRELGQINLGLGSSDYESMVKELRSDMQVVENFCRDAPHQFGNKLFATYHFRKHLHEALKQAFGSAIPENLTTEQKLKAYFKEVPNVLFAADNRPFTFSQNGLTIKSTWNLDTGYLGVKSQPYVPYTKHFVQTVCNTHFEHTAGSINTHFQHK